MPFNVKQLMEVAEDLNKVLEPDPPILVSDNKNDTMEMMNQIKTAMGLLEDEDKISKLTSQVADEWDIKLPDRITIIVQKGMRGFPKETEETKTKEEENEEMGKTTKKSTTKKSTTKKSTTKKSTTKKKTARTTTPKKAKEKKPVEKSCYGHVKGFQLAIIDEMISKGTTEAAVVKALMKNFGKTERLAKGRFKKHIAHLKNDLGLKINFNEKTGVYKGAKKSL